MRYTTRIIVPPRVRRSGAPGTPGGAYSPQVLGVRKTFGFGDRLGLATPGHLAAVAANPGFAPMFAQQSTRELSQTGRGPAEVVGAASRALSQAKFRQPWGADADGLKQPSDVEAAAAAGFTFFTIDPSEYIRADADRLPPGELSAAIETLSASGELPEDWAAPYLERAIDLPGSRRLRIEPEPLQRAVVKFGQAISHCARMAETVARACQGRPFEIEVSFAQTHTPTTVLEHLFVGLELEARRVRLTSLALRIPGEWQPGIDYRGDLAELETRLTEHAAVAQFCGPYKLSFHGGSDKLAAYPVIGKCCGDALHVKTSGASYLEALRVVLRTDPGLFSQIVRHCRERFEEDGTPLALGATAAEVASLPDNAAGDEERIFLDERIGRQLLHVTYGSVLSGGRDEQGRSFKDGILELLDRHADIYHGLLAARFSAFLQALNAG